MVVMAIQNMAVLIAERGAMGDFIPAVPSV